METVSVPSAVWFSLGVDPASVMGAEAVQIRNGTGAASGRVDLITAHVGGGSTLQFIRKIFEPLRLGPHAEASLSPDHWAYWRRELIAYGSGVLPQGPVLRAPRLISIVDDVLYLEYIGGERPTLERAALNLGRWHHRDRTSDLPWLARDQLAQRLAVSELNWDEVEIDSRLPAIWAQRHEHLARLDAIPRGVAHGDFNDGNLRGDGLGTVALDWATLGVSPVGFDLAHLALASRDETLLPIYLDGLQGRYEPNDVSLGYRTTVSLVGASRAHWMASRSIPLPTGYVEFICANQP